MNPCCPYKGCKGFLFRKHSGTRAYQVCSKNKKHKVLVNSVIERESRDEERSLI